MAVKDIDLSNIKDPIILRNFQILFEIIKDLVQRVETLEGAP